VAQRNITADKPTEIKSPSAPRAQERELSKAMEFMIREMSQKFRKQVFEELNQTTVEKFEDAQTGNYASIYLKLADRVRRKLLRQFDDKRIEELVEQVLGKVNKRNQSELYGKVEKRIGLSTTELTATEGLMADINALNLETSQWVKKLRDDTLEMYTANSLRAMTQGTSLSEIMEQFDDLVEKRKNHRYIPIGDHGTIRRPRGEAQEPRQIHRTESDRQLQQYYNQTTRTEPRHHPGQVGHVSR